MTPDECLDSWRLALAFTRANLAGDNELAGEILSNFSNPNAAVWALGTLSAYLVSHIQNGNKILADLIVQAAADGGGWHVS